MVCPGAGLTAMPVRLRVALVSVVMGCLCWYSIGVQFWSQSKAGWCERYPVRMETAWRYGCWDFAS